MAPILMGDLVRGDIGDIIDRVGGAVIGKKTDAFRIGQGAGKALRETGIAREFDDAQVIELERPEIGAVIIERGAHRRQHAIDVEGVLLVVKHCQLDAVRIGGFFGIGRRLHRKERQDGRRRDKMRGAAALAGHVRHFAARRHRRLVGIGHHGYVRCHPIGIADVIALLRLCILEFCHAQFGGQAIFAALDAVAEQAIAAHADLRGKIAVVQKAAIVDDLGIIAIGAKALLPALGDKGQLRRRPGRQRCGETIDAVIIVLVIHHQRRARHFQPAELHIGIGQADVQVGDRRAGIIDQLIAAARIDPVLAGEEFDGQRDGGHRGLGDIFIFEIFLLIGRLDGLDIVARAVFVEDIGVRIDISAARPGNRQRGDNQHARHIGKPRRHAPQARQQRAFGAAPPQQMRQHGKDQRHRPPVEPQPPCQRAADSVAVHVRQLHPAGGAIIVERVFEADIVEGDRGDEIDDHHPPADIFVGAERLDEHRQHGEDDHVDAFGQQVPAQIFARRNIRDTAKQLDQHRRDHAGRQCRHQHAGHCQRLGHQIGPVGQRGRIDDFVHLAVAIAPDQFAGIIDGDDHGDDAEGAAQRVDERKGQRPGRGAIDFIGKEQPAAGVEQPDEQQHEKRRAFEHLRHFETRPRQQPGERRVVGARRRQGGDNLGLVHRQLGRDFRLAAHGAQRQALFGKAEAPIGEGQRRQPDAEPDQPVPEQPAGERRQLAVRFGRGPIAGDIAEGRRAKGLDQPGEIAQFGLRAQRRRQHQIGDEKNHDADIGIHHRARRRRDGKEDRRREQHIGQSEHEIGKKIVAEPVRPQRFRVEPRHQRTEEDRQRHKGKGGGSSGRGAGKARQQIIELAHPG